MIETVNNDTITTLESESSYNRLLNSFESGFESATIQFGGPNWLILRDATNRAKHFNSYVNKRFAKHWKLPVRPQIFKEWSCSKGFETFEGLSARNRIIEIWL